jgi:GT2 family glycosyltransferase
MGMNAQDDAMTHTLRVSIVVPTFHRVGLLMRCLHALLAQRLPPEAYEVVVVDDGREDAVRMAVEGLASRRRRHGLPTPRLSYLRNPDGQGPAAARNCGWRMARAPIVAFTDDDTIPDADWLAAGLAVMDAHPAWSAAAGRVHVPLEGDPDRRPTDHELMTLGLARAEFVTANAFVRRSALAAIGGFDERFRRAWREDSDLQFRLRREQGPVGRADDAVVVHPVRRERWGISLRQQRNAFFDALLYKKHPRLYRESIRRVPPWDYYLIVALAPTAAVSAAAGQGGVAATALVAMLALVLRIGWRRLRVTDRSPRHAAEMLLTSAAIPFLSVWWRLRGALHFRVLFL